MASNAATATLTAAISAAPVIILAVVTLGYVWLCWMRPFRRCPKCEGTGWTCSAVLRRPKPCRRCVGEGWRLRHGRRAYNHLHRLHRDGTRADTATRRTVDRSSGGPR